MFPKIKIIKAREMLNSRGNPTLEVLAETENIQVKASVPAGASKGKNEAKELRDNNPKRFNGLGVLKAVNNVNKVIAPKLIGQDPIKQEEIDNLLIKLDGTKDKSNLGANAIVGVSMAVCKLGAKAQNIPLWQHIENISKIKNQKPKMPLAGFNIINGGKHAGNELAIQEFMIVPQYKSFAKNLETAAETYHRLKELIQKKMGKLATNVGDEGGFAPPIYSAIQALDLLKKVIDRNTKIILDCAANSFKKGNQYLLERSVFTKDGLLKFYQELIKKYPIMGIEDPCAEDDFKAWEKFTSNLEHRTSSIKPLIIGDDLLVTNPKRIKMAKEKNLCNGAIIKINQIGTVSEAIEAAKLAKSYGWKIIVSHRSGDTCDSFIADFAVGVGADFIKSGAPARGERVAKYNRLLEIEEETQIKKLT